MVKKIKAIPVTGHGGQKTPIYFRFHMLTYQPTTEL
jgi:hypothetical protein